MQTLAAEAGVALGAAEQVSVGVVAVAHHPAAHHLASLSGEHRTQERTVLWNIAAYKGNI